jgi:ABC-type polysaccharide/polyol phosphate export permease
MATLDASTTFQQNPLLRTVAHVNPFAILFESYRAVIYGKPEGGQHPPDFSSLLILLVASVVLVAFGAIVFKRLEPTYAKVL